MPNIDNLNFKVIIDDKAFNAKIEQMEKAAKEFNVSMSRLLDVSKASQQWSQKDVDNNRRAWQAKVDEQRAQEKINREKIKSDGLQRKINAQIDRATKGYQTQSRILSELKGYALGYLSIHGATQLLSSLVRVTGEFELQKTTLAAMLGDLNSAEQIITRIQGLAVESPFQFKELTTYAKQLSAFSVPAQELYDTTKMLADVSAGLGVGMDRIVLAYGQVRSAAFLRGQEVRQFTEAGIPILDELAKQFSELEGRAVSTGEVFDKISARLVPFEMVAKVFKDMTSEGGKFYNMQEVQAETLQGKISNLKDAYEVMLNEIGKNQSEDLKGAVDWARKLMQNYEDTGRTLVELASAYGIYKVAVIAAEIATKTFSATNHGVIGSLVTVGRALMANPYAAIATAFAGMAFAVYKTATSLESYEKVQKSVVTSQEKHTKEVAKETAKLDSLYAKLNLAKKGTKEYDEAKKQIFSQYAGYISEIQKEGIAVDNLTTIYGKLKEKIEQSADARFRITAARNLENTYDTEMDKMFSKYERLTKNIERFIDRTLSATEKEGLWQYLIGNEQLLKETPELHGLDNAIKQYIDRGTGVSVIWLKEQIRKIMKEYEDGKKQIDALFGEEPPAPAPTINPFEQNLGGGGAGEDPADRIQREIEAVKRLRDAYETLAPYMNGEMLRRTLTALFPNADQELIQSLNFRAKLVELAGQLNEFDENAAQVLLDSISGERAGDMAAAFVAFDKYRKMMDAWRGEDFTLNGTGFSFDVSKIIRNLNNEYAKITEKSIQANDLLTKAQAGNEEALAKLREVLGEETWLKYVEVGSAAIDALTKKEKDAAKKIAQEKINSMVQSYVGEQTHGLNLSDWGDKSIGQVQKIKEEFAKIQASGIQLDESLIKQLDAAELSLEDFAKEVAEAFAKIGENIDDELLKKIVDLGKVAAQQVLNIASALGELAQQSGNSSLAKISDTIGEIGDVFSAALDGFKSGGVAGGIIAGVGTIATKLIEAASAAAEMRNQLALASVEYQNTINEIRYANIQEAFDNLFGSNNFGKFKADLDEAKDAMSELMQLGQKINSPAMYLFQRIDADYRTGLQKFFNSDKNLKIFNLKTLFDEDGNPIEEGFERLKAYYDAYGDHLDSGEKVLVDSLLSEWQRYEDAIASSTEYLSSIFSEAASLMADSFIDSFKESGEAALEYGEIMDSIATAISKSLIENILLQNVFTDEVQKQAAQALASGDAAGAASIVESAMQAAQDLAPYIQEFLESMEPYFNLDEEGTKGLGEGIKAITEDQANLLASYLNAIRADVSFSKTLWIRMDANLQRIAEMFFSSPTLMEYQAQIAANTYDTAIATQGILARLNGVIGIGDDGDAIKIIS